MPTRLPWLLLPLLLLTLLTSLLPLPPSAICLQEVTWALKQGYPGRILSAEITPEDPQLMAQYGFDAIWVHSGGCRRRC